MTEKVRHVNLRLSPDLHAAATALADVEHRSLNSLIVVLLERAIRDAERKALR